MPMPATYSMLLIQRVSWQVLFLRTLIVGAGACLATVASANQATTATEPAAAGALEEIVVTATRREESISKVPISVTAFNQDMIDQRGIKDFNDVVRFTPGVSIDTSGTNAISIRGISSSGGAGTTGIYIDETPIQMRALGFNPDDTLPKTFDLDRVEVLRGPQGTLFGAGSEGGWIDRIDPTTLGVVDRRANRANTIAARLALLVQPTEGVKITPSFSYQNARKHDISSFWPAYSDVGSGRFINGTPERIPDPDEYYLGAVKLEADVGIGTLIWNTSYYHRDELTAYQGTVFDLAYFQSLIWPTNPDGSGGLGLGCAGGEAPPCSWYPIIDGKGIHLPPGGVAGYVTPNRMTNRQRIWTDEIRLQSNDDNSRWRWTVGAFWSLATELSIEELSDPYINNFYQYLFGQNATDIYGPFFSCPSDPAHSTPQTFPQCDIYFNNNKTHDRQLAGFGEVTYGVTDKLKVTVGARYAKLSGDLAHYSDGLENYGASTASGVYSEHSVTPKASIAFQADPNNLFYATYAKGFRPGGFNPPLPSYCGPGLIAEGYPSGEAPPNYNSDTTQSYEIGSKNIIADRFQLAASVYYIKWNQIQQNVYIAGSCALQFTDNLGTAVSKGFDLQANVALGAGFSVQAAVGYTNARFTATSKNNLAIAGDAIAGEAAIDYAPGTNPPWNIAIGPQYDFTLAGLKAFARVDFEYASRNPWLSPVQDPNSAQYNSGFSYTLPATSFFSLRSGVNVGSWQVSAFVDNLFDKHPTINYALGQSDGNNPAGPPSEQQNAWTFRPRTIGITATLRL